MLTFKRLFVLIFCCLTILVPASHAQAEPVQIRVVTAAWLGYANAEGEGYYFDLLRRAFPAPDWELQVTVVPFARSIQLVKHGKADLVLGLYRGDLAPGLYSAEPVELDKVDVALTPAMARDWHGLDSLAQRKVQAYLAYGFNRLIPEPMYYEETSSLDDMLRNLNDGRIDAVLDYRPGIEAAAGRIGNRQFEILDDVISAEVYFGFADTPFGASLKLHFDQAHRELIDSGEQASMYDRTQRELGLKP
ncbi:ABC transporter substrate-binding protein [Shewanella sp. JM162201]|uniref:ABC transporter substrate-binding protein n=1 Tax=Shewanella jiangmenensis TaxID=2837387 RepID=A0ABS5V856_9GAMM|nr:ABC transporter substrate-binding protein [Shewanella jiangmenensis]MBT1446120.1 ABC transporter substrate-binding protein [Shewanella jiangmenensis]